jgi:hypothetical protein
MSHPLHLQGGVGRGKGNGRKGCLFLIIGSLVALLATGLYVLAVSYLTGITIEARHGEGIAYAVMNIVTPSYGIAMLCFYGILAIWYFTPTEEETKKQNMGLAPMLGQKQRNDALPKRTLWLITAGLLLAVLVTGAVAVNSYKLITPDGVSTYFFAETNSYQWKQVSSYTIDSDDDNGLSVTFTMRDGKQFEILQGVNSTTEKFDGQYTSVTHFAADLDDEMAALQVPRNVKHMERSVKLYKDTTLWPYVSRLIGYVELIPEPDETVAETEPTTEAVTDGETNS